MLVGMKYLFDHLLVHDVKNESCVVFLRILSPRASNVSTSIEDEAFRLLPLYAHSKLSSIRLSVKDLLDSDAARLGQGIVIVVFDLFIWIGFDFDGNDGLSIHPYVFCSDGSTTPRNVMCINGIPVDDSLVGSRFPFLNENFIEPDFQTSKIGSLEEIIVHLDVSIGFVTVIEPVYYDVTWFVATGNVVFVLDPIDGVDVEASNIVVEDLVGDTFRRVDFVPFLLSLFRHQFYDGNVNVTIGDLEYEILVDCSMLGSDEKAFFHLVQHDVVVLIGRQHLFTSCNVTNPM